VVEKYKKLDEIPFDFTRRMMSVLVEDPEGKAILLTKGAPEEVFHRARTLNWTASVPDGTRSDGRAEAGVRQPQQRRLPRAGGGNQGSAGEATLLEGRRARPRAQRVRRVPGPAQEHCGTRHRGPSQAWRGGKILTGDNHLISRKVCKDVGLSADPMLLGGDVEKMSDAELAEAAEKATLFARLSPAHKERVIRALRGKGHVVGFMGDGINDAPALRAADVGISVDTATDIAKESADLILLEKDLMVLEGGVIEGRKVFANILKYIRMGASSNFGNMFSVLGASAFLPSCRWPRSRC
jgi:Mg2+-importing ATPase